MHNDTDLISDLPDAVLVSILSLLPMKQAARAAIVSRRWRVLCADQMAIRQHLDFIKEFRRHHSPQQFVDKVNNYMKLSVNSKVKRFFVCVDLPKSCWKDLESWVEFVAEKGVEDLALNFTPDKEKEDDDFDWNGKCRNKFTIKACAAAAEASSLRSISLTRCDLNPSSDFVYLGSFLRHAKFNHINIGTDDLRGLLSSCPVLESLQLWDCKQIKSVVLDTNSLKDLVIVYCWELTKVVISAPNLKSFQFFGNLSLDFTLDDISCLEELLLADIDSQKWGMLHDVSHVKTLTLCYLSPSDPEDPLHHERIPVSLDNLKELQLVLKISDYENLDYISDFFQFCSTPMLERMFIQLNVTFYEGPVSRTAVHPDTDGAEAFVHLKMLKVTNFYGTKPELNLLLFFLDRAPVLEKLVLVAARSPSPINAPHRVALREKVASLISEALLSPMLELVYCEHSEDLSGFNPTHTETYVS